MSTQGPHTKSEITRSTILAARGDFPILHKRQDGRSLVYLDSAATTQKPQSVIDAVRSFYENNNANVHRSLYELGAQATEEFEAVRIKAQNFLHAPAAQEIIFTRGTTDGINLVAHSFGRRFIQEGDEILITSMEHHSNIVPWQVLCQERGAILRVVPLDKTGRLQVERFAELLSKKTKLVALAHVSNVLGTINPIKALIEAAHQVGAKVLIDGAQAVAHLPIDVTALDCDFYVCSGHKMLGPTGVGLLYAKADLLEAMPPYQSGGDMVHSVSLSESTFKEAPHKFESGTPNIAGVIGLGAALDYLNGVDLAQITEHEQVLLAQGTALLESIEGLSLQGPQNNKTPIWSLTLADIHPHDLAQMLDEEAIAIRAGHHCAQPLLNHFGLAATARISLGLYNSVADLESLSTALTKIRDTEETRQVFYQETMAKHSVRPQNFHPMSDATCHAEGKNPLCGDSITLFLEIEEERITHASFTGSCCAIARASASLLTTELCGKSVATVQGFPETFEAFITAAPDAPVDLKALGALVALKEVRHYPVRSKCATLPFRTMLAALDQHSKSREEGPALALASLSYKQSREIE